MSSVWTLPALPVDLMSRWTEGSLERTALILDRQREEDKLVGGKKEKDGVHRVEVCLCVLLERVLGNGSVCVLAACDRN